MSRFDLIFPLTEQDHKSEDDFMFHTNIHQIANTCFFKASLANTPGPLTPTSTFASTSTTTTSRSTSYSSTGEQHKLLALPLLRFYIEHVRQNVHPVLSDEAKAVLFEFYKTLRKLNRENGTPPVTLRQMEGLVRLNGATQRHAVEIIKIVKFSMDDTSRLEGGKSVSGSYQPIHSNTNVQVSIVKKLGIPKQMDALMQQLETQRENRKQTIFSRKELKVLAQEVGVMDFEKVIIRLNEQSTLLMQAGDRYKYCP